MISAIVYHSQTGSCERYAKMLSAALHLPLFSDKSFPGRSDGEVIFVTWALAGKAAGLKKLREKCRLAALVQVGMSPVYPGAADKVRAANGLGSDVKVFVRQGAFHMSRLPLPFRLIMKLKCKEIAGKLAKKDRLNEAEQALYKMAVSGEGEPPVWTVSDIVEVLRVPGGGLSQKK